MKKILLVTLDFPPAIGGVSNYLVNICQQIKPEKIVVLAQKKKNFKNFDCLVKFKIIRKDFFSPWPIWPKWLFLYWQIKKIIKQERIDLIWVGQILPLGTICYWLERRIKKPYWLFTYGMDILLPQKIQGRKLNLANKIIQKANKLITISGYTQNQLLKLGADKEKIIKLFPCPYITIEKFPINQQQVNQLRLKYQLIDKKIILTVGRLVKRKGFDMIIKSLLQVIKQFPQLKYVIVGQGKDRQQLEILVKELRLNEYVIFTEEISDQELATWYQACDLFTMVPRKLNGDIEGFGFVYLEANSFKKPVIGSYSGGVPDAIADNLSGLLVKNPKDTNEIAEKIIKLLTNKSLAYKLGQQGYYRVINEFIWEKQVAKIKPFLNE